MDDDERSNEHNRLGAPAGFDDVGTVPEAEKSKFGQNVLNSVNRHSHMVEF
jgi:hypothetical protein